MKTDSYKSSKESEVLNWVRKKSGPAYTSIQTFEELEKLKTDSPVCIIYYVIL